MTIALDARELKLLTGARHPDPFAVLGKHVHEDKAVVRAHIPGAQSVSIADGDLAMARIPQTDVFEWHGMPDDVPDQYRFIWRDRHGREHISHDPYCFSTVVNPADLTAFNHGNHVRAWQFLGSRVWHIDGVAGVLFVVWAPNACRVSVVGDFNEWDGRHHCMRAHPMTGIWELFIPELGPGTLYKYEIRNRSYGTIHLKSDPYGRRFEVRPNTASLVEDDTAPYPWQDADWLTARAKWDWQHSPLTIYEVHLGSWQRGAEGEMLNYRDLAPRLVDYVKALGFSYIELLPITEHPYDPSWGYQATGYFAPTSRYGSPDDFRYFVDYCHQHGIGIILDWVPAHFPKDAHGLARFDGTACYEHEDPRRGEHLDWSTLIYNYGRQEVKSFLLSSAMYWLEEMHLDGLRVDAVASMLYLDYSRTDWIPNKYGGRENLEAIDFLRELNIVTHREIPGVLMAAEESTSWPQVTRPVEIGGLGFDIKWNMGWMNDTLVYIQKDPVYRKYHHDGLTFSMVYAFTENFLLPFSHDEVVHGKHNMLWKMPGDEWQRFANIRLLYTYMFTHPGKKLLFMGTEIAQGDEWDSAKTLDWYVLDYPYHQGIRTLVSVLSRLYHTQEALYHYDFEGRGFEWIDCHDHEQSVLSYIRRGKEDLLIVVLNFTPAPRRNYRIGVPLPDRLEEVFNSDSSYYAGSNMGNGERALIPEERHWMNQPYSLEVTIPPLAGIVLAKAKPTTVAEDAATDTAGPAERLDSSLPAEEDTV